MAASGGYMMACVANKIIAAPYAIIGSIGVIAQIPNLHRWLDKQHIDFEQITAGQYKRTLTMFGKNTSEGRKKLQSEVNETHDLFKDTISQHRQHLDMDQVATGEHWYGSRALELKLVDKLQTSDDYLLQAKDHFDIFLIKYAVKKNLNQRLSNMAHLAINKLARLGRPYA